MKFDRLWMFQDEWRGLLSHRSLSSRIRIPEFLFVPLSFRKGRPLWSLASLSLFFFSLLLSFEGVQAQNLPVEGGANPAGPADSGDQKEEGVRLKDLARISGVRSNQLLGYGVVVGLPGTGDTRSKLASSSLQNLIGNLGHRLDDVRLDARNIAAVLVTCEIPAFSRKGDRLNVTVSSIGDARSIEGGVLVQTPLYAGNNQIFAVAQGVVATGGSSKGRMERSTGKTVGTVVNGALVERVVDPDLLENRTVRVSLNSFDFSSIQEAKKGIEKALPDLKVGLEGSSILVEIPEGREPVEVIAAIEEVRIQPRSRSRVVINERTGTIVMGGDIRIDPVAVSRGGLQLTVQPSRDPSQMGIYLKEARGSGSNSSKAPPVMQEFSATSVQEVIEALNSLGAGVRDIIAILEALKDSGALHAELIII